MDRAAIKERAKSMFTSRYWPNVGIFAIIAAFTGGVAISSGFTGSLPTMIRNLNNGDEYSYYATIAFAVFAFVFSAVGIAYTIFVANPISVSSAHVALGVYDGEGPKMGGLIYCVRNGRYKRLVGTMALVTLFTGLAAVVPGVIVGVVSGVSAALIVSKTGTALASLVIFALTAAACIPAIIVSLGLSRVPYILAEDEGDSGMNVLKRSWQMMEGHKGSYFVFGLSFFGWIMLTVLSWGVVGIFYANPYMNVALAGYHRELSSGALID